jgi:hypothetical protein
MAKPKKPFACDTCTHRHNQIWGTEDEYISYNMTYDLVFVCKKNQDPPKRGIECPKWKQMSDYRSKLNSLVERNYLRKYKRYNEMEDWEQELHHFGIDDMPGFRD